MVKSEFDHVAAIVDDRRRAIGFLSRAISELELAEVPALVAQLETALRSLREMTPGADRPRRKYGGAKIGPSNGMADARGFGARVGSIVRGG